MTVPLGALRGPKLHYEAQAGQWQDAGVPQDPWSPYPRLGVNPSWQGPWESAPSGNFRKGKTNGRVLPRG